MTAFVGQPVNYYQKWDFVVEVEGVAVGGFNEATGFEVEHKVAPTREGGVKGLSALSYTTLEVKPVTLKRGASNNRELYLWNESITAGNQDLRNVSVVSQKGGLPVKRANYTLCALTTYKDDGHKRDAEEENVMEEITFMPTDGKLVYL